MKTEKYTNRYGNEYTFTLLEDENIEWVGDFSFYRASYPNDYTKAYDAYKSNGGEMSLKEFEEEVHQAIYDERGNYIKKSNVSEEYEHLVESNKGKISMVDPFGGPYLSAGMKMLGKTIKEFKHEEKGSILIRTK